MYRVIMSRLRAMRQRHMQDLEDLEYVSLPLVRVGLMLYLLVLVLGWILYLLFS